MLYTLGMDSQSANGLPANGLPVCMVLDIETNVRTGAPVVITVQQSGKQPELIRPSDTLALQGLAQSLASAHVVIGHNLAFDFATLQTYCQELKPIIWQLYARGRISDTMIREKLLRIAAGTLDDTFGGFALADLASRYGFGSMDKSDSSWRMRFHELQDVPLDQWPASAIAYCTADVDLPYRIYQQQAKANRHLVLYDSSNRPTGLLLNETQQVRAALSLELMSQGGIHTDPQAVEELAKQWTREVSEGQRKAAAYFRPAKHSATQLLFDVEPYDPTKDTTAIRNAVEADYAKRGQLAPRTEPSAKHPKGQVRIDEDTLSVCTDPGLIALREMTGTSKLLSSFLPVLQRGIVHPSYDILKATGRTSSFDPNIQQLPRNGGVRECFVPRPGYLFIECDYNQVELCALAQVLLMLFGKSAMADAIREGKDLHLVTAGRVLDRPYESVAATVKIDPAVKGARQLAKAANFGYPGGMGAEKFIDYARQSYGLDITLDQSISLKAAWFRAYPEMRRYFDYITRQLNQSTQTDGYGKPVFQVTQLVSGRLRGGCGFCDGANTMFQGLAADGAKAALWATAYEAYNVPTSPLYGCIGGAFIHDELLYEAPAHRAHEAAHRLGQVMVQAMKHYIKDVPIKAEPLVMDRWYKSAEPVYDANGKLATYTSTGTKG